jgi:hypothetical protein
MLLACQQYAECASGRNHTFKPDSSFDRTTRARDNDNVMKKSVINMVRTQISLSEEEYLAAKREAERLGISLAELLRRSLRSVLTPRNEPPWMRFAGMIESGDPDSSQRIDELVYDRKD